MLLLHHHPSTCRFSTSGPEQETGQTAAAGRAAEAATAARADAAGVQCSAAGPCSVRRYSAVWAARPMQCVGGDTVGRTLTCLWSLNAVVRRTVMNCTCC